MITGSLDFVRDKNQNYNTEFRLFPKVQRTPVFNDTPINAFKQYTWLSEYVDPTNYTLKNIIPSSNKISMMEGTAFQINLPAVDPSNLFDPTDDSKITYVWKRDGSTLFEYSSLNSLRGTSIITITSESCTRDVSGVYELEATNRYGTTVSEQITIDVINKKYNPILFKNLIINGSGEQGTSEWTADADITTKTFSLANRNQFSIPKEIYSIIYDGPYTEEFNFSIYPNETALSRWFDELKNFSSSFDYSGSVLAGYNRWIVKEFLPCLVPTDGGTGRSQDSFFPSWDYIDTYNKNKSLYKLEDIVQQSKTYITRDKLKFTKHGGKAKSIVYQTIDLTNAAEIIDGEVYGVDKVVAHFFAYVGIGISNYALKYTDESTNSVTQENAIPTNLYTYKVGSLNGKPALLPLYPNDKNVVGIQSSFDPTKKEKYAKPIKIKENTPISIEPVTYDKTDIRLDFINVNGDIISSEIVPGPTEKDIWAVKEKFYVPYYIGNLYSWFTNATNQEFRIYSQSYTTINAIRAVDDPSFGTQDINAAWIKKYYYPLLNIESDWDVARTHGSVIATITKSPDIGNLANKQEAILNYGFDESFVERYGDTTVPIYYGYSDGNKTQYDRGAAAFFGIQKDVVVPKGTRSIRVNIIFNHTSETIYDANPKLKNWTDQNIYLDYFTRAENSDRLVEYGNPRCGVTAAHLSLHPNRVEISEDYNTYNVNLTGSVWKQELDKLDPILNPTAFNTVNNSDPTTLQYKYSIATIPALITSTLPAEPITIADISVLAGQNTIGVAQTQSGSLDPSVPEVVDEYTTPNFVNMHRDNAVDLLRQLTDSGSIINTPTSVTSSYDLVYSQSLAPGIIGNRSTPIELSIYQQM